MNQPQFILKFQQENADDFHIIVSWLIEQTGMNGWNFTSKWKKQTAKTTRALETKIFSALTIEDTDLALLAKLTFPEILMDLHSFDGTLEDYFFYNPTKYHRVNNKNHDIIPMNL